MNARDELRFRVLKVLSIRPEQMVPFEPVAEVGFVGRLAEYLRVNHIDVKVRLPSETLAVMHIRDDVLHLMIRNGIARARTYGLTFESALSAFVVLMFVAAPNFDIHPSIRQMLVDEKVSANERLQLLWQKTSEQDWEIVRQNYDPAAWAM